MPAAEGKQDHTEQHLTYLAITGTFWTIFAVFNLLRQGKPLHLKPFDFVLLVFSTFRLGRLIAYDRVTQPYRAPFTETVLDSYGASETVVPKQYGWRRVIGELISCPICSGTWVAAALVYALQIAPGPARIFITIMGTIGAGEILNALTEALSWGGESSRKQVGHN